MIMKNLKRNRSFNSCLLEFENYQTLASFGLQGNGNCLCRTFILGIGLIFFSLSIIQAQDIKFGAKAGVNFANDTGDGEFDTGSSTKAGIHIGGVAQLGISDKFAVQGELLYSMQGFKDEVTHKLDYINLPILAEYSIIEGLSVQAGPQFGFNIKDTFDDDGYSGSLDAKSLDLGAILGAQYEFPMNIFAQIRYQAGLSDFIDYNTPSKHSVLSFSVGYFF